MAKESTLEQLNEKGADVSSIADQVVRNPKEIESLIEALKVEKRAVIYGYEKVLRLISEQRPELIYSYFDDFVDLLDGDNIMKQGKVQS